MSIQVKIEDEVFGGEVRKPHSSPAHLILVSETLTAREIVIERAKIHFESLEKEAPGEPTNRIELAHWLSFREVMPASAAEAEAEAICAFQRNEFFFFWNDKQVLDLEERLLANKENMARFVQIVPLKGG